MLNEDYFKALVSAIINQSQVGGGDIAELIYFTNDGVISVAGEEVGTVGLGIASRITMTEEVLKVVSDINQTMYFGHFWVSPGTDSITWSLICGFKFFYEITPAEYVGEILIALVNHHQSLSDEVRRRLGEIPHTQFWDAESASASALALSTHLH